MYTIEEQLKDESVKELIEQIKNGEINPELCVELYQTVSLALNKHFQIINL